MRRPWEIWVDTGGTFTDAVGRDPAGTLHRAKVLSSSALRGEVTAVDGERLGVRWPLPAGAVLPPGFFAGCSFRRLGAEDGEGTAVASWNGAAAELRLAAPADAAPGDRFEIASPDEAPVLAARLLTGAPHGAPLPPMALRLATTRGTNALLERRGAAVALFVTRGFADLLAIGSQQRPDLFALEVVKPPPLYAAVVEVDERLDAEGRVLAPPDLDAVEAAARRLTRQGFVDAAVALLHSYLEPAHERAVAARLRAAGFERVAESAALAPEIKIVPRAGTAVVEAYLAPVLESYLDGVAAALPEAGGAAGEAACGTTIQVMTSAGGLVRRDRFRAKDSLLSGPAGGVAGMARAGRRSGFERLIGLDMGGTSTDVARYDGDFEYLFEHRVGDAHLVAPALAIETVAAGGGSVCAWRRGALAVGPESAGARPGPACYGGGGPLTLTDVNLLLGYLDPARFGIPVDAEPAERAFAAVAGEVGMPRDDLLAGFRAIADERMADAVRSISLRRGYDPRRYALVAFGGAGGQHACAVAARLGVETVLVPGDAGLLSALGLGAAVVERFAQRQVLAPLADLGGRLPALLAELAAEAASAVAEEEGEDAAIEVRRRILQLRFAGQESTLAVEPAEPEDPAAVHRAFAAAYRDRYGYLPRGDEAVLELESVRVVASARREDDETPAATSEATPAAPAGRRRARLAAGWREVAVYERAALAPGARFAGPALVYETHGATVVEAGWQVEVDAAGALLLRRRPALQSAPGAAAAGADGSVCSS